jgi:hypothetical protein
MRTLTTEEARSFCEGGLPAWTGNDPAPLGPRSPIESVLAKSMSTISRNQIRY